jgi:hypothetical protein
VNFQDTTSNYFKNEASDDQMSGCQDEESDKSKDPVKEFVLPRAKGYGAGG